MKKLRVLLLSGGGWHGAVQVPVLHELLLDAAMSGTDYDVILGVSVGAIHGWSIATNTFDTIAVPLWQNMDDKSALDGIDGFARPALHRGRGLIDLVPLERKLERLAPPRMLNTVFGAGVVRRNDDRYYTSLHFPEDWQKDDARRTTIEKAFGKHQWALPQNSAAVIASAAVAGVMEPVVTDTGVWCDGGHIYVLPRIPDELLPHVGHIDAVFCKPVKPYQAPTGNKKVDGLIEGVRWAIERQMEAPRFADYAWLKAVAAMGVRVKVYSPNGVHGGMLDAERSDVQARFKLGEFARDNPEIL